METEKIKYSSIYFFAYNLHKIVFRVCLHRGGGPQIGEVTCGGSQLPSCERDQIKMRDYMDRRDNPPNRVNSPTWGEVESPLHLNKPLESTSNPQSANQLSPPPSSPFFALIPTFSTNSRGKACYEGRLAWWHQMNSLTLYFPRVTNLNILLTISIHNQENKLHVCELIK